MTSFNSSLADLRFQCVRDLLTVEDARSALSYFVFGIYVEIFRSDFQRFTEIFGLIF